MAVVQGIKEKLHLPLYDSVSVEPEKQLRDVETSSILKFFVNVQGKTKLETNLQSASLLPHYNTFEARAMRVVISDLPPRLPEEPKGKCEELSVTNADGESLGWDGTAIITNPTSAQIITATLETGLDRLVDLLKEARESDEKTTTVDIDEDITELFVGGAPPDPNKATVQAAVKLADGAVDLSIADLEDCIIGLGKKAPPKEQLDPNNGAGTIIGRFIYNTVTTLFVGEKIMIQMPTWFFPAGAGPYSEAGKFATHGEPDPMATFRFAEPLFIDKQQNFRVEIEIPDSDSLKRIQQIYGPFSIWVVLDGYMTRDVQ